MRASPKRGLAGRVDERAPLLPWSPELLRRSAKRAAFPALVWVAFLPLFADLVRVPWTIGAPLGTAAIIAGVAAFERRGRDTTVVVMLGTMAILFAVMLLSVITAAVVGVPRLFPG